MRIQSVSRFFIQYTIRPLTVDELLTKLLIPRISFITLHL